MSKHLEPICMNFNILVSNGAMVHRNAATPELAIDLVNNEIQRSKTPWLKALSASRRVGLWQVYMYTDPATGFQATVDPHFIPDRQSVSFVGGLVLPDTETVKALDVIFELLNAPNHLDIMTLPRSMSVGDVVVAPSGDRWVLTRDGWKTETRIRNERDHEQQLYAEALYNL